MSKLSYRILLVSAAFLILPFFASAASCSENTIVQITARDPDGSFIPNASVDIYTQTVDANGSKKPGTRLAGGTTSATLGSVSLTFKNSAATTAQYALRIRTIAKDSASFWFFDNTLDCGETAVINKTLSGLLVSLHEADGGILANSNFSVYTQLHDANGNLENVKNELMGSFNSGTSGQVKIYLPQGSLRGITSGASDYYVFEFNHNNIKSEVYNIYVSDGSINNYSNSLSILRVRLKYDSGASTVGATVEVYKQKSGINNENLLDTKVGSFVIAGNGYGSMEVSPGLYALRVKVGSDYKYFWSTYVSSGNTSDFLLNLTDGSNTPGYTSPDQGSNANLSSVACTTASNVYVSLSDFSGQSARGLKFEIYEQNQNFNGLPIVGTKVLSGTTNEYGQAVVSFKPTPDKKYALKVYDKKSDLGEFWFYDAIRFVCGYDRTITKNIPALKIVLRDTKGELKRNYNFSLYLQTYDADNNPIIDTKKLIANLQTDAGGTALVYVSPYNTYGTQTGIYAITLKDANGNLESFYNIRVNLEKDLEFESVASGLSGQFQEAGGRILASKVFYLYEQKVSNGVYVLGDRLLTLKTDTSGEFQFEYPAGNYALVTLDALNRNDIFWNVAINGNNTYQKFTTSLINFNLSDPQGKGVNTSPTIILYSLAGSKGTYVRDKQLTTLKLTNNSASLALAAGQYLAYYAGAGNQLFGQAFYVKNGSSYTVNVILNSKYLITNTKSFSLSGADSNIASGTASNGSGNTNSGSTISPAGSGINASLTKRLKGRILLQVQDKGQAWYVNPSDGRRYSLGRPEDAYNLMRRFALGVSNSDFTAIENNPQGWSQLAGRILLKPNDSGRAYYFDPVNLELYYLGRPDDAYNIMRQRGLGITNSDLTKISDAE
ncbi:MAG: hypothetical protein WC467_02995 [Patescibacteria group bacterium]